jgi:NTP pyrophosphatase (non-canonical NTP hydrolase)
MRQLQADIHQWANEVFPDRTVASAMLKLYKELSEVIENPNDATEYADVAIILLDLAEMHGVDLEVAVIKKMAINRNRKWKVNPITGVMSHIRGQTDIFTKFGE